MSFYKTQNKRGSKANSNSLNKLFRYVFRVSYIAVKFTLNDDVDFHRWSIAKRRFNRLINHAVVGYLGESKFSQNNLSDKLFRQLVIESINEIINRHYSRRVKIFLFCQKFSICKEWLFVNISMFYVYVDELIAFLYSFENLRTHYAIDFKDLPAKIDLSIALPKHAFSTSEALKTEANDRKLPYASFGDFLKTISDSDRMNSVSFISIDEYVRHSRKKEEGVDDYNIVESGSIAEYSRYQVVVKKSVAVMFLRIPQIIFNCYKLFISTIVNFNQSLFALKYFRLWAKSYKYKEFIGEIKKSGRDIRYIYILPFSNVGLIKYDSDFLSLLREYSYSHNMYIPPIYGINNPGSKPTTNDILREVQVGAFCLTGYAVGFTSIFDLINKYKLDLNEVYSCKLPIAEFNQPKEHPVLMGFEIETKDINYNLSRSIAVFDVPPEATEQQLSRAIAGDKACDFKVIEKFLSETIGICIAEGYNVIYKPKYSLLNYVSSYQLLIKYFSEKYGENFIVASPYLNMVDFLSQAHGCISFPYTSTKVVAQAMSMPSIYYMPEEYRTSFLSDSDLLIGENELSNFIKNL